MGAMKKYILLILCVIISGCCKFRKKGVFNPFTQSSSGCKSAATRITRAPQAPIEYNQLVYDQLANAEFVKDVHSIYFKSKSDKILDEGLTRLNNFLLQLSNVRNASLIVRGYSDRAEDKPQDLSLKRANAVKKILIKSGILISNAITIELQAFGTADPLISYNTVDNNPVSRRVDLFIK